MAVILLYIALHVSDPEENSLHLIESFQKSHTFDVAYL